eukprot:Colp12_sorted_trinity150504_noHs@9922
MSKRRRRAPKKAKDLDMSIFEDRLSTFVEWPHVDYVATPEKLAAAGFYFDPQEDGDDNVRCFSCSKNLGGWESEDDPLEEHKKHTTACDFIKSLIQAPEVIKEPESKPTNNQAVAAESNKAAYEQALNKCFEFTKSEQPLVVSDFFNAAAEKLKEPGMEKLTIGEFLNLHMESQRQQLVKEGEARIEAFKIAAKEARTYIEQSLGVTPVA